MEDKKEGGSGIMSEGKSRGRALTGSLLTMTKAAGASMGYGAPESEGDNSVALGFISLLDVDSVEELGGAEFMFCLRTTERVWMLHAESSEEMRFWVDGLRDEIAYLKKGTPESLDKPAFRGSDIKIKDILVRVVLCCVVLWANEYFMYIEKARLFTKGHPIWLDGTLVCVEGWHSLPHQKQGNGPFMA